MSNLDGYNFNRMESLNAMFEFATEGIVICDVNGVIIKANPSSEKLFGYTPGELTGKVIENLIPARYTEKHLDHRKKYNEHPHPRAMGKGYDLFGKKKDGSEFPLEISLTHYKFNEEMYVIAFIIDITERKKAEENIRRINADLERKVDERTKVLKETMIELEASKEELSRALEKEKELNDMKSRFVTMASHEFRTPLSTILSSVSLIGKYKTSEEEEKRHKHVERIKSAVTNMTLILNDFLSAGKLEEGKISFNPVEINIPQLVSEILTELGNLRKPGQKAVYNHRGDEICVVDKQMVRNILNNLVSNAIKFSPENKEIFVDTENIDNHLSIQVTDQGIGIPKEEHEKLFERFFRSSNASNIQGTGLGLSIVAKYVEYMNGKIEFNSELNIGTTFKITIPVK